MGPTTPAPNKRWYLKQIHLFSGLNEGELEELERLTQMVTVKKGKSVCLPGEAGNSVYLLKKGRVKTAITGPSGKRITFEVLEPGEIFGECDLPGRSPHSILTEALDDSLICTMRREDFERYLTQHPHLIVNLIKLIGLRFSKLLSQVENLAHRDMPSRLAYLLLVLSKTQGVSDGPAIRIRVKLSHQEMAHLIGCARETVTTILSHFREQGLIRIDQRFIIIRNLEGLSRLVPGADLGEDIRQAIT